jgi:hypothetical protein
VTFQISRCRSCDQPVHWTKTQARDGKPAKAMPVDADDNGDPLVVTNGNLVPTGTVEPNGAPVVRYVPTGTGRYRSHFASCAQADNWRRK